jgi:hydrogenase/urease accessory protein HupE
MHVKSGLALMLFLLALTSPVVLAHTSDSHNMNFFDGLLHLVSQADHVLLLAPIILLVLGYRFRKLIMHIIKPYRARNDRF